MVFRAERTGHIWDVIFHYKILFLFQTLYYQVFVLKWSGDINFIGVIVAHCDTVCGRAIHDKVRRWDCSLGFLNVKTNFWVGRIKSFFFTINWFLSWIWMGELLRFEFSRNSEAKVRSLVLNIIGISRSFVVLVSIPLFLGTTRMCLFSYC